MSKDKPTYEQLELAVAKLLAENTRLREQVLSYQRRLGIAPHDFEPARPGLSEVD